MIDPAAPSPQNDQERSAQARAAHERRIGALERAGLVPVGTGAPTADPTKLPEGAQYLDRQNRRKYYVLGDGINPANNVWRYVALT